MIGRHVGVADVDRLPQMAQIATFPTPGRWALPVPRPERLAEMRLIAEAAVDGDFGQGVVPCQHEFGRVVEASTEEVGVRRAADGPLEGAAEVAAASLRHIGELADLK